MSHNIYLKKILVLQKMKNQQLHRKIVAPFLLMAYLFVVLFSQNFHNHGSGEVFRDFHFKKSEKTISANDSVTEYSDCLSCHLMHDGKNLIPQEFGLKFVKDVFFEKRIFSYQPRFSNVQVFGFFLRGPPAFFI